MYYGLGENMGKAHMGLGRIGVGHVWWQYKVKGILHRLTCFLYESDAIAVMVLLYT